jgi:hypothetical protein
MLKKNLYLVISGFILIAITTACSLFGFSSSSSAPKLPNYGVFLVEGDSFIELEQYSGAPSPSVISRLATTSSTPSFFVWNPQINLQYFLLVNLNTPGRGIQYKTTPRDDKGEILQLTTNAPLPDGIHCFVQGDPLGIPYTLPFWCFLVQTNSGINASSTLMVNATSTFLDEPTLSRATVEVSQADGLLSQILSRGTIVIAIDPNFPKISMLDASAQPSPDSLCNGNQATSSQMTGFDADVSREIGLRLGVEPCFVFPRWTDITAGNWGDKWDISVGSMVISPEREKVLFFTSPYYSNEYGANGIAIDKASSLPVETLVAVMKQIVTEMHEDGTLSDLSIKSFGKDQSK